QDRASRIDRRESRVDGQASRVPGARVRRKSVVAVVILGGVLVSWLAWRRAAMPRPIESGACAGCNVLLITIDTLRSDRVGAFGGPPGLTPMLDRLALAGLRLTRT